MTLNLVIPARNEAVHLARVLRLAHAALPPSALLVLADSASNDNTADVVGALISELPNLRLVRAVAYGKGRAICAGWDAYPADRLAFMDADLATDLEALPRLIAELAMADVVVGSRRHPNSVVERDPWRRAISFIFYRLFRWYFPRISVRDSTCGFKAVRGDLYRELASQISDRAWFFDTELIIRAYFLRKKIVEIPVIWKESAVQGRRTSVKIFKVALDYLKGLKRLKNNEEASRLSGV